MSVLFFLHGDKFKCRILYCCLSSGNPTKSQCRPFVCMYGIVITYSKSKDQPGKVANCARDQLNRENQHFPRSCLRIWSRETGSVVPSCASLLISILRLNQVLTYGIPLEFRGGAHLFV